LVNIVTIKYHSIADDAFNVRAKVAATILFPDDITNDNISGLPSFTTALDLCIQKSVPLESSRRNGTSSFISSGSKLLDILLSPSSSDLIDGGPSCTIHPSIIASKTVKSRRRRRIDGAIDTPIVPNDSCAYPSLHEISNYHRLTFSVPEFLSLRTS